MTSLLRKPMLRSLAFCMPLLAVTAAHAGIVINGTRIIFPGDKNEVTVKLTEESKKVPGLAKMWLDTGDQNASPDTLKVPFDITPPAQRIEPGHSQSVRIIFTGDANELPKDRESVFWFNMLDVPPKKAHSKTSSTLQFAFDTRIKLFYRPAGLPGTPELAMKGLKWTLVKQGDGYALKVENPSPYFVSMSMTVRDTGIGIDEAGQARLFEPFVQVGTRHQGGTGLGLAICKRLITAMGGEIRLRSAPGKGTSVDIVLTLPIDTEAADGRGIAANAQQDPADAAASAPSAATLELSIPEGSILLVEDQPLNQELLARQFQALGVRAFDTANNGLEAWQAYRKHAYALVLTDCAMPMMDGEELIRHIRASEANTDHPACLIALTANATDQQRQACLEAGADDVIIKPVDLVQLRDLLIRVFGGASTFSPRPAVAENDLPAGISGEEWRELRKQIVVDMQRDLATAQDQMSKQNWQQAWEAAHRILGTARWFKLKQIVALASAAEEALRKERTDVAFEPLRVAIASLAEAA